METTFEVEINFVKEFLKNENNKNSMKIIKLDSKKYNLYL